LKPNVFISHALEDRAFVEREILDLLKRHGIDARFASGAPSSAPDVGQAVLAALSACDWFVVVLSAKAIASEAVRAEARWAVENRADRILPVLIEVCEPGELYPALATIEPLNFRFNRINEQERLLKTWGIPYEPDRYTHELRLVQMGYHTELQGSIYPIRDRIVVGRLGGALSEIVGQDRNAIMVRDGRVSTQHAEFVLEDGDVIRLTDIGSANGTFVNQQWARSVILNDGDEIRIGGNLFLYRSFAVERRVPKAPDQPVKIFCGHSPEDAGSLSDLEASLAVPRRAGLVELWSARHINPGEDVDSAVKRALSDADIILLLISASYLSSDSSWRAEVRPAFERQARGQVRVIPVIVRSCSWRHAPFAALNPLPADGKPVSEWPSRDQAWTSVADGVMLVIEQITKGR
jgi:hypothetical protein